MYKIKTLLIVTVFLTPLFHYGQHTDVINSNRPGKTMSAFSVGKSVIQLETGVYGIKEKHNLLNYDANGFGADLDLRYGLFFEQLEFVASIEYQYEKFNYPLNVIDKSALKQTVFGAKYLVYDPFKNYKRKVDYYSWKANHKFDWHQFIPAVSVFVGANYTLSNNPYAFPNQPKISPKIMLITQNHLGDGKWVFVTNIFADYIATDYPSYGYVLTLTRGFNDKWSGFIENQGFKSDFYSDAIVRIGAAYLVNKDLQIDASISKGLKDTPSVLYGGVGVSWRYDANYKPVKIKIPDADDDKKESTKKKKK